MTREEILQDLAYARTLAEEGRHAPLLGGAHLVMFGVLNAIAFTAHWCVLTGRLPLLDGAAFAILWMSYGTAASIGLALLRSRTAKKPGNTTVGARAEQAVWSGVGLALAAIAIGSILRMILTEDVTAPNAIFGAAFGLYGAALFVTGKLSQERWLTNFAWISAAVSGVLCIFANSDWAYLTAAVGSLLVLVLPGVTLLRREPSTTV